MCKFYKFQQEKSDNAQDKGKTTSTWKDLPVPGVDDLELPRNIQLLK